MNTSDKYDSYETYGWTQKELKQLAYRVIGAAIEVHKELGPGLLESVYEVCLLEELRLRSISVAQQVRVPLNYKGRKLGHDLILDLIVEDVLIIELKAITTLLPVHQAQLISYMELSAKPRGILINFNVDNITRSAVHLVSSYFPLHGF